jgi:hypothetical protein
MAGDTFQILAGVRRAKVADLLGHTEIWAVVEGEDEERRVPISCLLSPKKSIDTSEKEGQRWSVVVEGMTDEPDLIEPIVIRKGTEGIPIRDVELRDS